jgi:hypothetical protein
MMLAISLVLGLVVPGRCWLSLVLAGTPRYQATSGEYVDMEPMSVDQIVAWLKDNPQLRVAECLAAWTHGDIK